MKANMSLRTSLLSLGLLLLVCDVSGQAVCTSDEDCEKSCGNMISAVHTLGAVKSFPSYSAAHGKCVSPAQDDFEEDPIPAKCRCYNQDEDLLAWFDDEFDQELRNSSPKCSADECNSRCEGLVVAHKPGVKGNTVSSAKCVSPRCVCYNWKGQELAYFEAGEAKN